MEDIFFREYKDSDYDGFLSCINDFYADGYPYPYYLDRKNIYNMQKSGELILTVAVDKGGEIVGTVAALKKNDNLCGGILLLLRSVLSKYRGRKIASRQLEDLLQLVKERFVGAKCFYADVMTHDAISQCSLIHRGYTFCGLRCMAYKNELIAPKIAFEKGTKMTQAVYCKAIDNSPVFLYVPNAHKEKIKEIYNNLGVNVTFLKENECVEGKTKYSIETDNRNQFSEIIIDAVGIDFFNALDKIRECLKNKQTVIAYLNMKDSGCLIAYNQLRMLNFYFSGISPLFENSEYLILCQTDNCKENFHEVQIYENKEEIINYILGGRTSES